MIGKFLRGFVDGSLFTLGIVIGASSAINTIIIAAPVGGTLANGISNLLSAYSAEGVEQYSELRRIEQAMVSRDMKGWTPERQVSRKTITIGALDGSATIIGGGIPILPYLFLPTFDAMLVAIGTVVATVGVVGIYLGKLPKSNILLSGLKMAALCIAVAGLVYLVQSLIVPSRS